MKKLNVLLVLFLAGCAYRNPLEKADFRFQTLSVPPYVLSGWYHISAPGQPLVVYVEENAMPPTESVRQQAVKESAPNVAYIGRPCQYFQTPACVGQISRAESDEIVRKGIEQLKKKAATRQADVKGMK